MRIIKSAAALGRRELQRLGLWSPEGEGRTVRDERLVANTRLLMAILVLAAVVGTIFEFGFPMMLAALLVGLVGLHLIGSTYHARAGATSELKVFCVFSGGASLMLDAASVEDVLAEVQKELGEDRPLVFADADLLALGRWDKGDGEKYMLVGDVGEQKLTIALIRTN